MRKLNVTPFQIQAWLLVLAHPEDLLFSIERLETHGEMEIAAENRPQLAGFNLQGAAFRVRRVASVPGVLF